MARYWDFSLPSAEVKPTEISKINTALQLVLVGTAIGLPVVPEAIISSWHLSEAMTGFQYVIPLSLLVCLYPLVAIVFEDVWRVRSPYNPLPSGTWYIRP